MYYTKNGGLSSARNAGLDIAKGEYIGFVDSDDFINEDMYSVLINALRLSNKKIACCYSFPVKEDDSAFVYDQSCGETKILDTEETLDAIFLFKIGTSVWRRLFHKSVFENLRFPVGEINEEYPLLVPMTVLSAGTVLVEKNCIIIEIVRVA